LKRKKFSQNKRNSIIIKL